MAPWPLIFAPVIQGRSEGAKPESRPTASMGVFWIAEKSAAATAQMEIPVRVRTGISAFQISKCNAC